MKKLMIAAAFALCACVVQAASVTWSTGAIKLPGEGGAQSGSAMTSTNIGGLYLWSLTAPVSGDVLASVTSYDEGSKVYTVNSGSTAADKISKGSATISDPKGDVYGTGSTAYAVVLVWADTDGSGTFNAGDYYIAQQGSYAFEADADKTVGLGMDKATWATAPGGTTPTPEPTSGLLILLGMAGLALKRKVA